VDACTDELLFIIYCVDACTDNICMNVIPTNIRVHSLVNLHIIQIYEFNNPIIIGIDGNNTFLVDITC